MATETSSSAYPPARDSAPQVNMKPRTSSTVPKAAAEFAVRAGSSCFEAARTLATRRGRGKHGVRQVSLCVALLREAVHFRHPGAMHALGNWYVHGIGVKKNHVMAFTLFRRAARLGDIDAQYELGVCLERGHGTRRSHRGAAIWYERAGRAGDSMAQYAMGRVYQYGLGRPVSAARARMWYRRAMEGGEKGANVALRSVRSDSR
jgi:TPR repeat protein